MQPLQDRPYDFDFFQAVRRLECTHRDYPRIGYSLRPQQDPVKFQQHVSLAFEPSAIKAYQEGRGEHSPMMAVNFFGLLGTNGPLPLVLTEYIYDRLQNHKDKTIACFLDIFNHRMISLFYRAWACNNQAVSQDRKQENRFVAYIGSLLGIGAASLRDRDAVPDAAKLHYSGLLACQCRNAEGLRQILHGYFGFKVDIEQFVGQWLNLPQEYLCQFGKSPENAQLGSTLVVGSRIWVCQQKFRIRFGPMDFCGFRRMLPGGDSIRRLAAWVRNYVGDELNWELQLILRAAEVPRICLGKMGRLGWSTWLSTKKFEKDADDLVLRDFVA
jgi:type VI secretion system protein ImpH